jgi:hypothetical protein
MKVQRRGRLCHTHVVRDDTREIWTNRQRGRQMNGVEGSQRCRLEAGGQVVQRIVEAYQRDRCDNVSRACDRTQIGKAYCSHRLDADELARDEPLFVGEPAQEHTGLRFFEDGLDES